MKNIFSMQKGRGVLAEMSVKIQDTFKAFDAPVEIVEAIDGLRQYHFHLKALQPVRMKVIKGFENDLRYALASRLLTIEAPLLGKTLIGITVPKEDFVPELPWHDVIKTDAFKFSRNLTVPLGRDEFGEDEYCDITRAPHIFIAGVRWSGKSMLLNSIVCSLLEKNTPQELRFIMIDPKRIELTLYDGISHLLAPVITEAKVAIRALKWCVNETERRLRVFEEYLVVNISAYHEHVYNNPKFKSSDPEPMPYVVVVIEDFSDLMAEYPKEFEAVIVQLTKLSRMVGIHIIISTQRATTAIFTPLIRGHIPTRIAFRTASAKDSRAALEREGAEYLLGNGDMLFFSVENHEPKRIQGFYITEEEIRNIVKKTIDDTADSNLTIKVPKNSDQSFDFENTESEEFDDYDEFYEEAKSAVLEAGKASTSYLQRKLKVGYSRAARLIDLLETRGVIGQADGSAPRKVIGDK